MELIEIIEFTKRNHPEAAFAFYHKFPFKILNSTGVLLRINQPATR